MFGRCCSLVIVLLFSAFSQASIDRAKTFMGQAMDFAELTQQNRDAIKRKEADELLSRLKRQVDFSAFANRSLGNNAGNVTEAQKKRFTVLLEELIELAAFPKASLISAKRESISYSEVGKQAVNIKGKIERDKDGDLIVNDFSLQLFFSSKGNIYDLRIEDELLSANIERQIKRNLEKKNFSDLLALMEKRVEKLKNPSESKP